MRRGAETSRPSRSGIWRRARKRLHVWLGREARHASGEARGHRPGTPSRGWLVSACLARLRSDSRAHAHLAAITRGAQAVKFVVVAFRNGWFEHATPFDARREAHAFSRGLSAGADYFRGDFFSTV